MGRGIEREIFGIRRLIGRITISERPPFPPPNTWEVFSWLCASRALVLVLIWRGTREKCVAFKESHSCQMASWLKTLFRSDGNDATVSAGSVDGEEVEEDGEEAARGATPIGCEFCLRRLVAVTHRLTTADQVAEAEAVLGRALPLAAQPGRGHGLCSSCGNAFVRLSVNLLFAAALVSAPALAPSHCVATVSGVRALSFCAMSVGRWLLAPPTVGPAPRLFLSNRAACPPLRA